MIKNVSKTEFKFLKKKRKVVSKTEFKFLKIKRKVEIITEIVSRIVYKLDNLVSFANSLEKNK
jgi:hypothetical protein